MIETRDPELNYQDFFLSGSFDGDPAEYPDHNLLQAGRYELLGLFGEIQAASFRERVETLRPFQLSPLWLECTHHIMEGEDRVRVISQILKRYFTVLRESVAGDEAVAQETFRKFVPHFRHSLRICKSFKIRASELSLSPQILDSGDRKLLSIDCNPGSPRFELNVF